MKKILEAIKRNTMLKVFSLIIAILLWAFVQLAQNPEISYDVFEVPVTITGEAGINNEGFVISNPPANLSTNVTISTKRTYLNSFDHASLSAYVDVSNSKDAGDHTLPIRVRTSDPNVAIISKSPANVSLYVDRIITVRKPIRISYDGNMAKDYYIDAKNVSISPKEATIKVPELVEKNIHEIVVHLDMTDVTSDINGQFAGVAVNAEGEEVMDKFLSVTDEAISVKVPVLKRKTVPVSMTDLPESIREQYTLSKNEVEIAGSEADLNKITQLNGSISYDRENPQKSYVVSLQLPKNVIRTNEEPLLLEVNAE